MNPHHPYLAAVAAAIGSPAEIDWTEYGGTEAADVEHALLLGYISPDGPDEPIGLAWTSDTGWTWGYDTGNGQWDNVNNLHTDKYATPAQVAAALKAARAGHTATITPDHHPDNVVETLPDDIAAALIAGDIDTTAARILAAYWPTPRPAPGPARITIDGGQTYELDHWRHEIIRPGGARYMHLGGWIASNTPWPCGRHPHARVDMPDVGTYRDVAIDIDISHHDNGRRYVAIEWPV